MTKNVIKIIGAADIGAGRGAKIEIAQVEKAKITILAESLFQQKQYGNSVDEFTRGLLTALKRLMSQIDIPLNKLCSLGIDLPGFLDANQNIQKCVNLSFLNGTDIRSPIQENLGIPVNLINDGNSGALAEWNIWKKELVYWVFGGGWGGSWISRHGKFQRPTNTWKGFDHDIHISDEPGYKAEITKDQAADIFNHYGSSLDTFLKNLAKEKKIDIQDIKGPDDNPETLRAEVFVSGQGLWRIFQTVVPETFFSSYPQDVQQILNASDKAGAMISKLYSQEDPYAKLAFSIMSLFFSVSTLEILAQITKEGAPMNTPIFLGGGMAKAFDHFVPLTQKAIIQAGFGSVIQKSHFLESDQNANLIGAIWLAVKHSFSSPETTTAIPPLPSKQKVINQLSSYS